MIQENGDLPRQTRDGLRRLLMPVDGIIIAYLVLLTGITLGSWTRIRHPETYVTFHAVAVAVVFAVAWAHRRFDNRVVRFVHYWIPVAVLMCSFRELHYLVSEVHPWADRRYDWALHALDQRLFGDVAGLCRSLASRAVADVLFLPYLMFYIVPAIFFAMLHVRGKFAEFRRSASVVFVGWYLSYIGYIVVPAQGPHHVTDGPRAPELDGALWAKAIYDALGLMEMEMPDAFPSGHTLVAVLVLWLAWRYVRDWFWVLLPVAVGIVLGTVYLRYHYLIDVVAGFLLVPISVWAGDLLADRWEARTQNAEDGMQKAPLTSTSS
jgi:membrane-associated phospholipid phosphatase